MRILYFSCFFFLGLNLYSCKSKTVETNNSTISKDSINKENFFPVTDFIRGEIFTIKLDGINPRMYLTHSNKTDSSWVKMESLDSLVAPFLTPIIDTTNLKTTFLETGFLDQTINQYTFTYARRDDQKMAPELLTWNVYLNTDNNKVSSIYMEKIPAAGTKQIMTWQAGKSCKIITLQNDKVVEEKYLTWNYDENDQ